MRSTLVIGFIGVAVLAYVTPGPDWFVVMRHASCVMRHAAAERPAGIISALGVQTGLVVHMSAAALGVAALLLASAEAFTMVKLVGAAYLVFLGGQALIRSYRLAKSPTDTRTDVHAHSSLASVYRQSLLANVLNPKAALFFAAVLPQFISVSAPVVPQILLLGALDIALGIGWWFLFVYGIARIKRLLGDLRSRILIDRASGCALIGLGGALALTSPPRA